MNLKRRSGTADDKDIVIESAEKRLKVNKSTRVLAGEQKKPPKFVQK